MNPAWGLLILIVLFLIGIPVTYALGFTALVIMYLSTGIKWVTVGQQMMYGLNSFTILAVPLFLLAGKLMNKCGVTDRLFGFARTIVGWLPGGLGHVNVLASFIFAGMSGTAIADASGLGMIEIKAMEDAGYDKDFSCAVTAASSSLGPIIPPSMPLVVYGTISGTSIGALFPAGVLPGLVMVLLMMVLNLMIGVISPPFGVVLFAINKVGEISFGRLVKALVPWMIILLGALLIITLFPQISTWLPLSVGLGS